MEGEAFSYASAGFSYAQPLPVPGFDAFSIGASLRLLLSAAYAEVGTTRFSMTTAPYGFDIDGEYEALYAYPDEDFDIGKAIGFSGDLGLAARFAGRWTVSAGVAYEDGPVLLAIDYCQGFSEGYMSSTKPQFSIGTEYRGLPWLPLRM